MLMFLSNMSQGVLLHLDVALLGTIMVSCFLVQLILFWLWIQKSGSLAPVATEPLGASWEWQRPLTAVGAITVIPYILAASALTWSGQLDRKTTTLCRQATVGGSIDGLEEEAQRLGLMFSAYPPRIDATGAPRRASIEVFGDALFARPAGCLIEHEDGRIVWKGRFMTRPQQGLFKRIDKGLGFRSES
jgi:hypothetical protein